MSLKPFCAPAFIALLSGACAGAAGDATSGSKNILGYGVEVSSISDTLYEINVRKSAIGKVGEARDAAMLRAAQIALSRNFPAFEITGGSGFRKRARRFQAGPLPVILPGEPSGGLVIRLSRDTGNGTGEAYDARKIIDDIGATGQR